ncbi:MAG: GDSL-type esterase/lipase family protein, partial [Candidatus Omnitrophica bacterium]|nr:GDSL-type esterase/lipase family protein [Candidatus Omnitrophota bacterium]
MQNDDLERILPAYKGNSIVLLLIGTNDISDNRPHSDIQADIKQIIANIARHAGREGFRVNIVLCSLPPRIDDNLNSTEGFNQALPGVIEEWKRELDFENIFLLDVFRAVCPDSRDNSWKMYMSDPWHLNRAGYERVAQVCYTKIKAIEADGGYFGWSRGETETQLRYYEARRRIRPASAREMEYLGPHIREALSFLERRKAKHAPKTAPPIMLIETDRITFGAYFNGRELYIEAPLLNYPSIDLSSVFVHELNNSSHFSNSWVEGLFDLTKIFRTTALASAATVNPVSLVWQSCPVLLWRLRRAVEKKDLESAQIVVEQLNRKSNAVAVLLHSSFSEDRSHFKARGEQTARFIKTVKEYLASAGVSSLAIDSTYLFFDEALGNICKHHDEMHNDAVEGNQVFAVAAAVIKKDTWSIEYHFVYHDNGAGADLGIVKEGVENITSPYRLEATGGRGIALSAFFLFRNSQVEHYDIFSNRKQLSIPGLNPANIPECQVIPNNRVVRGFSQEVCGRMTIEQPEQNIFGKKANSGEKELVDQARVGILWQALPRAKGYYVGLSGFSRDHIGYWQRIEEYLNQIAKKYTAGLFVRVQRIEIWRNLDDAANFSLGTLRLDESLFTQEAGLLWQEAIWHEVITGLLGLIEPNRGIREVIATYKSIEHFVAPLEQADEAAYQQNILAALSQGNFSLAAPLMAVYREKAFPFSEPGTRDLLGVIIESINQQPRYQAEQLALRHEAEAAGVDEIELAYQALEKMQILFMNCERLLEVWQQEAPRNNREIIAVNLQLAVNKERVETYLSRKLGDLEQPELGVLIESLEMLYKLSEFEILRSLLGVLSRPRLEIMHRIFQLLKMGMLQGAALPLGYQVAMGRLHGWAASMQLPWDMVALRLPDWVEQALILLNDPERGEAAHFKREKKSKREKNKEAHERQQAQQREAVEKRARLFGQMRLPPASFSNPKPGPASSDAPFTIPASSEIIAEERILPGPIQEPLAHYLADRARFYTSIITVYNEMAQQNATVDQRMIPGITHLAHYLYTANFLREEIPAAEQLNFVGQFHFAEDFNLHWLVPVAQIDDDFQRFLTILVNIVNNRENFSFFDSLQPLAGRILAYGFTEQEHIYRAILGIKADYQLWNDAERRSEEEQCRRHEEYLYSLIGGPSDQQRFAIIHRLKDKTSRHDVRFTHDKIFGIALTTSCPLKCRHCLLGFSNRNATISPEALSTAVAWANAQAKHILLSGGDAWIRKDLFRQGILESELEYLTIGTSGKWAKTLEDTERELAWLLEINREREELGRRPVTFLLTVTADAFHRDRHLHSGNQMVVDRLPTSYLANIVQLVAEKFPSIQISLGDALMMPMDTHRELLQELANRGLAPVVEIKDRIVVHTSTGQRSELLTEATVRLTIEGDRVYRFVLVNRTIAIIGKAVTLPHTETLTGRAHADFFAGANLQERLREIPLSLMVQADGHIYCGEEHIGRMPYGRLENEASLFQAVDNLEHDPFLILRWAHPLLFLRAAEEVLGPFRMGNNPADAVSRIVQYPETRLYLTQFAALVLAGLHEQSPAVLFRIGAEAPLYTQADLLAAGIQPDFEAIKRECEINRNERERFNPAPFPDIDRIKPWQRFTANSEREILRRQGLEVDWETGRPFKRGKNEPFWELPHAMGCGLGVYTPEGNLDEAAQKRTISALQEARRRGAIIQSERLSSSSMPVYLVTQRILPEEIITAANPPCLWFDSPDRFLVSVVIQQRVIINEDEAIEPGIYLTFVLDLWLQAVSHELRGQIYAHEVGHWLGNKENVQEAEHLSRELLSLACARPNLSSAKRILLLSFLSSQVHLYQIKAGNLIFTKEQIMGNQGFAAKDITTAIASFTENIKQIQEAIEELGILVNFLSEFEQALRFIYPEDSFVSDGIERKFLSELSSLCSQRIIGPLLFFAKSVSALMGLIFVILENIPAITASQKSEIQSILKRIDRNIIDQAESIWIFIRWLNRKLESLGVVSSFLPKAGRGCGLGVYTKNGDLDFKAQIKTFAAIIKAQRSGGIERIEELSTASMPVYSVRQGGQAREITDSDQLPSLWFDSPQRFLLAVTIPKRVVFRGIGIVESGIYIPIALVNWLQNAAPELLGQITDHEISHWVGASENVLEAEALSRQALDLISGGLPLTRERVDQIIAVILANARYIRPADERFVNALVRSFFSHSHNASLYQRIATALENVTIELYICSGLEDDGYWQMESIPENKFILRIFVDRERAGEHFDAKVMHEVAAAITATFAEAESGEIRPTSHETNLEVEDDYAFWTANDWVSLSGTAQPSLNYVFGETAILELSGQKGAPEADLSASSIQEVFAAEMELVNAFVSILEPLRGVKVSLEILRGTFIPGEEKIFAAIEKLHAAHIMQEIAKGSREGLHALTLAPTVDSGICRQISRALLLALLSINQQAYAAIIESKVDGQGYMEELSLRYENDPEEIKPKDLAIVHVYVVVPDASWQSIAIDFSSGQFMPENNRHVAIIPESEWIGTIVPKTIEIVDSNAAPDIVDLHRAKENNQLPSDLIERKAAIQREIAPLEAVSDAEDRYLQQALRELDGLIPSDDPELKQSLREMRSLEKRAGNLPNLHGVVRKQVRKGVIKEILYLDQPLLEPENERELKVTLVHEAGARLGREDACNEADAQRALLLRLAKARCTVKMLPPCSVNIQDEITAMREEDPAVKGLSLWMVSHEARRLGVYLAHARKSGNGSGAVNSRLAGKKRRIMQERQKDRSLFRDRELAAACQLGVFSYAKPTGDAAMIIAWINYQIETRMSVLPLYREEGFDPRTQYPKYQQSLLNYCCLSLSDRTAVDFLFIALNGKVTLRIADQRTNREYAHFEIGSLLNRFIQGTHLLRYLKKLMVGISIEDIIDSAEIVSIMEARKEHILAAVRNMNIGAIVGHSSNDATATRDGKELGPIKGWLLSRLKWLIRRYYASFSKIKDIDNDIYLVHRYWKRSELAQELIGYPVNGERIRTAPKIVSRILRALGILAFNDNVNGAQWIIIEEKQINQYYHFLEVLAHEMGALFGLRHKTNNLAGETISRVLTDTETDLINNQAAYLKKNNLIGISRDPASRKDDKEESKRVVPVWVFAILAGLLFMAIGYEFSITTVDDYAQLKSAILKWFIIFAVIATSLALINTLRKNTVINEAWRRFWNVASGREWKRIEEAKAELARREEALGQGRANLAQQQREVERRERELAQQREGLREEQRRRDADRQRLGKQEAEVRKTLAEAERIAAQLKRTEQMQAEITAAQAEIAAERLRIAQERAELKNLSQEIEAVRARLTLDLQQQSQEEASLEKQRSDIRRRGLHLVRRSRTLDEESKEIAATRQELSEQQGALMLRQRQLEEREVAVSRLEEQLAQQNKELIAQSQALLLAQTEQQAAEASLRQRTEELVSHQEQLDRQAADLAMRTAELTALSERQGQEAERLQDWAGKLETAQHAPYRQQAIELTRQLQSAASAITGFDDDRLRELFLSGNREYPDSIIDLITGSANSLSQLTDSDIDVTVPFLSAQRLLRRFFVDILNRTVQLVLNLSPSHSYAGTVAAFFNVFADLHAVLSERTELTHQETVELAQSKLNLQFAVENAAISEIQETEGESFSNRREEITLQLRQPLCLRHILSGREMFLRFNGKIVRRSAQSREPISIGLRLDAPIGFAAISGDELWFDIDRNRAWWEGSQAQMQLHEYAAWQAGKLRSPSQLLPTVFLGRGEYGFSNAIFIFQTETLLAIRSDTAITARDFPDTYWICRINLIEYDQVNGAVHLEIVDPYGLVEVIPFVQDGAASEKQTMPLSANLTELEANTPQSFLKATFDFESKRADLIYEATSAQPVDLEPLRLQLEHWLATLTHAPPREVRIGLVADKRLGEVVSGRAWFSYATFRLPELLNFGTFYHEIVSHLQKGISDEETAQWDTINNYYRPHANT